MNNAQLLTDRMIIRPLEPDDALGLLQYVTENKEWLGPWEPVHPRIYFTLGGQRNIILQCREERLSDKGVLLGIFSKDSGNGQVRGRISISGITRGIWQNGFIGYSIEAASAGQGFMTEALNKVVQYGFNDLKLHRMQASIIPRNKASHRVLEKCNFRFEGRALKYLKINNVWEDHDVFALTVEDIERDL